MTTKTELDDSREILMYAVENALDKYKKALKIALEIKIENYYGGPAKFKEKIHNEDEQKFAKAIWDEAIEKAIEEVRII